MPGGSPTMRAILWTIAWRLALCAAITFTAWRFGGTIPAVTSLALVGVLLARPLIELIGHLVHQLRALAWRDIEGHHHAFQGIPVRVFEDEAHRRWVSIADVRRILGSFSSDATLARLYPEGWRRIGRPPRGCLSDEALLQHLAKTSTDLGGRFRLWVERDIAFPARRLRERDGRYPARREPDADA